MVVNSRVQSVNSKYSPWQTVFYHFTQFKEWNILNAVVENERKRPGKQDTSNLVAIGSQSVKKIQFTNEEIVINGGKNINGRKEP